MFLWLTSGGHPTNDATRARFYAARQGLHEPGKVVASARDAGSVRLGGMLTLFGASALSFMMLMYALERRHRLFVLAFALGCALSSAYGFLAGTWPFGVVELIWVVIALRRYFTLAGGPLVPGLRR